MKKELMTNAWEIAKNAAKKFGGKAMVNDPSARRC